MSSEVARVLREAADLIEPPGRWTRGAFARDASGAIVASFSDEAVCWCADGAMSRAMGRGHNNTPAWFRLYNHLGQPDGGVAGWNDVQPDADPVVAALRAAADEAERSDA